MRAYGSFYDKEVSADDFMDEQEMFNKAARIFEIELIETIRIKCGKGTTKYYNYVLIGDKDFYKFKNTVCQV